MRFAVEEKDFPKSGWTDVKYEYTGTDEHIDCYACGYKRLKHVYRITNENGKEYTVGTRCLENVSLKGYDIRRELRRCQDFKMWRSYSWFTTGKGNKTKKILRC
jgi:hypothetical protein